MHKKTMSTIFITILFAFLCSTVQLVSMNTGSDFTQATILYNQATENDLEDILAIMNNYSDDDKSKLLILPEAPCNGYPDGFRRTKVREAIQNNRYFVARDTRLEPGQNIISFVKVFVIETQEEKQQILGEELRLVPNSHGKPFPVEIGLYDIPYNEDKELDQVYNFRTKLPKTSFRIKQCRLYNYTDDQTMIYLGSAYTITEKEGILYRGHGISTILEKKALKAIQQNILDDITANNTTCVTMLYGLVLANKETQLHIRDFLATMQYVRAALELPNFSINSRAHIDYYMNKTYKPVFEIINDELIILEDDHPQTQAGIAYGCLLKSDLSRYKKIRMGS